MMKVLAYGCAFSSTRLVVLILVALTGLTGCLSKQSPAGVLDAGQRVVFTSPAVATLAEGTAGVFYTATTATSGRAPVYSLAGVDAQRLAVDASSGELSFIRRPNFESPNDQDGNNRYNIEIRATDDSGQVTGLDVEITVLDINEAPAFTSGTSVSTRENTDTGYTATAVDPEDDSLIYAISGGVDQSLFRIDSSRGFLDFVSPPDFDLPEDSNADNIYFIELSVDDGNGLTSSIDVAISVTDVSRLVIEPSFPTPNANLGGVNETMVTGGLIDLEDGLVEFDDVSFVDVDGQLAQRSLTNAGRWSARVPVTLPGDLLPIRTESPDQDSDVVQFSVRNEALIVRPDLISIGTDPNQLLIGDNAGLGALVSMHLPTGASRIVADTVNGSGVEILLPEAVVLDNSSNRVLVVDSVIDSLVSVDLTSGNRVMISGASRGAGPLMEDPLGLALDAVNNRVLVVDADRVALLAVDLVTGDRTVVSDASTGNGIPMLLPTTVIYDARTSTAYVADVVQEAVISVDLSSGDRNVVANAGTGASLDLPVAMAIDEDGGRILLVDINLAALISVDIATGVSSVVSDNSIGSGPEFSYPASLALDVRRGRALVVDLDLNKLIAVDLATGNRQVFAGAETGAGPKLSAPPAGALSADSESYLAVVDSGGDDSLIWIDVQSGNRSVLSDGGIGSGPVIGRITSLDLDEQNNRALLSDVSSDAILAVDLTSGDRSVVASASRGAGVLLQNPTAVYFDRARDRLMTTDSALGALISVDLASGDRSTVSDATTGVGPSITSPTSLAINESGDRGFVLDSALDALVSVQLGTGDRSIVSDAITGSGTPFVDPLRLELDEANNRALVADGLVPTILYWVDLSSGDRTVVSTIDSGGPIPIALSSLDLDVQHERAFALDAEIEGLLLIELNSGQRAVISR